MANNTFDSIAPPVLEEMGKPKNPEEPEVVKFVAHKDYVADAVNLEGARKEYVAKLKEEAELKIKKGFVSSIAVAIFGFITTAVMLFTGRFNIIHLIALAFISMLMLVCKPAMKTLGMLAYIANTIWVIVAIVMFARDKNIISYFMQQGSVSLTPMDMIVGGLLVLALILSGAIMLRVMFNDNLGKYYESGEKPREDMQVY